jgi:hypothetical protein
MQLNQRYIETDLQKDQRNINKTLRVDRRDALTWQTNQRDTDAE